MAVFAHITRVERPRMPALLLLSGLAACAGSPGITALRPDFEVMTPAGKASVSIRQSPPGMTGAEFTRLVKAGMERAAPKKVMAGPIDAPFPEQRIVWHVSPSPSGIMSQLVVNVFDGATPYAYEQDSVPNDASRMTITTAVQSMSQRLIADVAARADVASLGANARRTGGLSP
jgi:hypothetical protein